MQEKYKEVILVCTYMIEFIKIMNMYHVYIEKDGYKLISLIYNLFSCSYKRVIIV